jgi:hypothetical protein
MFSGAVIVVESGLEEKINTPFCHLKKFPVKN